MQLAFALTVTDDEGLQAKNGTVCRARRVDGRDDLREIVIAPSSIAGIAPAARLPPALRACRDRLTAGRNLVRDPSQRAARALWFCGCRHAGPQPAAPLPGSGGSFRMAGPVAFLPGWGDRAPGSGT